ncbi:phospholipase/carboxylesterase [Polaromonas sp. OV174]|uniref:esterase n=1 Tax=Polaromonas sp. OV174 TaxID=1855300 RepID=UPI0008EF51B7|nr:esterase [Polaromonas sp. OV174]SFC28507.1 phospholipase/carboxylesterase [Polaromonas sp. OV174]
MTPSDIETIELLPTSPEPRQLFVLLHDAGGSAADMLALGQLLGSAFPAAVVVLAQGLVGAHADAAGAAAAGLDDAAAMAGRVECLAVFLRAQQARFGVAEQASALAGFGAGASLALALVDAHDGLVGRVLGFGGGYQFWPEKAPALTTLHLLHGQDDAVIPAQRTQADYDHLMSLGGDATWDVATGVGHALHPVLMEQALTRLQTCVPLRLWKEVQ